jgi:hypothetical protein
LPRIRVESGEGAAALLRGLRAGGDPLIELSSRLAAVRAELMRPYEAFLLSAALPLVALVAMILLPEGPCEAEAALLTIVDPGLPRQPGRAG